MKEDEIMKIVKLDEANGDLHLEMKYHWLMKHYLPLIMLDWWSIVYH